MFEDRIRTAAVDDPNPPVLVIAIREVAAEVRSTALFPLQRRARDQSGDAQHVEQRHPDGVIVIDPPTEGLPRRDGAERAGEVAPVALDARLPPHDGLEGGAQIVDVHEARARAGALALEAHGARRGEPGMERGALPPPGAP